METRTFTKKELLDFIHSEEFKKLENIPISIHRAISQAYNPRAEEDDILLVAQFDNLKTVGYLGVLPDYIYDSSELHKAGWMTCFWVDEEYKSKNVAANLFLRVIRAWKKRILITNIVPWLEPVYQKTKIFQPTKYKVGFRGYLRFNLAYLLPPKGKIFAKANRLLKLIDFSLNLICDARFLFYHRPKLNEIQYEVLSEVDNLTHDFLSKHFSHGLSQRGKSEINWIIQNPWVLEGIQEDFNSKRYYFSSLSKRFFYLPTKFTNESGEIIGFALMNIRNRNLNIPYLYCDEKYVDLISKFILRTMIDLKLDMLTTYNEKLIASLRKVKKPFLFSKKVEKPYLISKEFDFVKSLNFQDGDGDCAFY